MEKAYRTLLSAIQHVLTIFASGFHKTDAVGKLDQTDRLLLVLIIAAGVVLRFWGLDNVGLHGDEETMAFPAIAVFEEGGSYLPSGMYYPRALLQVYAMSASVWLFGESEWALRLPSAVFGSLMLVAAFLMGRRFLSPSYNLMFVAVVALSPQMIEMSQTARMYIFWMAAITVFCAALFRWERLQTYSSFCLVLAAWVISLHFQRLSLLALPLFIFPALTNRSMRLLWQGIAANVIGVVLFLAQSRFEDSHYPPLEARPGMLEMSLVQSIPKGLGAYVDGNELAIVGVLIAGLLAIVGTLWRSLGWSRISAWIALLFFLGFTCVTFLHYHIAALAFLAGSAIWLRYSGKKLRAALPIAGLTLALVVVQLVYLHGTGEYVGRQLVGAVVGQPSVWPLIQFAKLSPFASVFYLVVILYALRQFARNLTIPDHVLFFCLSVWLPLLVIGMARWWVLPRYTIGGLPFFYLTCIAGLAYVLTLTKANQGMQYSRSVTAGIGSMLVVMLVVNPVALSHAVNTSYTRPLMLMDYRVHPDHIGAAEYLLGLPVHETDIVIAEDVLQQTYYLGKVDYWLRNISDARGFSEVVNGQVVDQYTHTPVIGTGDELLSVLQQNSGGRIFIISNGEIAPTHNEWARGNGIREVLQSPALEVVFKGRDGQTTIWKYVE